MGTEHLESGKADKTQAEEELEVSDERIKVSCSAVVKSSRPWVFTVDLSHEEAVTIRDELLKDGPPEEVIDMSGAGDIEPPAMAFINFLLTTLPKFLDRANPNVSHRVSPAGSPVLR